MLKPLAALLLFSALGSRLSAQDGQVVFERTGYRLTSLGGRVSVAARVLDGRRRAVPNAPIAWRIEDSNVATVDRRGVVQSRRVGRTRLWAVSGSDSASALILVDQWAARFVFIPAVMTFGAVKETRPVQVQARDASGNAIPGIRMASACRVSNPRIATMAANGQITANASGVTWLRCADRGASDSLRIEVRPRARSAEILDKAQYQATKQVNDSFQIRMRALDVTGNEITDARATWASLEPRVLRIDPLTGWARGVGVGSARVVAQLADITDTVDVTVVSPPGLNLAPIVTAGETAADSAVTRGTGRAEILIYTLPTNVGDTTSLTVIAKEPDGSTGDASAVTLRINADTGIVRLTRDRKIIGLREGPAFVVGTFRGVTDSARIDIRVRTEDAGPEAEEAFERPRYDTAAVRAQNQAQTDSAMGRILSQSSIRVPSGRFITGQALVAQTSHAARLSATDVETRAGLLFGGRLVAAPFRRLQASVSLRGGTLSAGEESQAEDMTVTEVDGALTFSPASAFSIQLGATMRGEGTPTAAAQWFFGSVGAVFHPSLIGDRFRTVFGVSLIPYGTLTEKRGVAARAIEPTSLSGEAGLEFHAGWANVGLTYYSERISFPVESTGNQRIDRFSMLRFRLGLQLGR
ncbi:MAG TPA: hypothetical protein VFO66_03490 [Gemmatimonadaceae bacterium]|nr:hypothetical protein [Gemmatimonadaceae bacterium]